MIAQFSGMEQAPAKDLSVPRPGMGGGRALPAWLPAPAVTRPRKLAQPRRIDGLWFRAADESLGERVMFLLLVLSAVIGIGYGFNNLVDLVQNWAQVSSSVGHLIQ